jgi:2-keto-4-pentenoate hydratase/2-oxohepta-3-ene-1,7-dioic acid hydratase in catechol pathway
MKYVMFSGADTPVPRLGILHRNDIVDFQTLIGDQDNVPHSLLALIDTGPDVWQALANSAQAALSAGPPTDAVYRASAVHWHAPIPRPRKNIMCLGLNYKSHIAEGAKARGQELRVPDAPVIFTKAPTAISGPYDDIPAHIKVTSQMDWEAELAFIIGIGGTDIPRAEARKHVFGYTAINDVTARDLQFSHKQWFRGKSLDGFCPMGPCVVTADEFGDPQDKRVSLKVNGVVKQDASTSAMLFPVDIIVETLSLGMRLEPGDVISTGTPEGVGFGRTPPEFLHPGDLVQVVVEGIGTLRNQVIE